MMIPLPLRIVCIILHLLTLLTLTYTDGDFSSFSKSLGPNIDRYAVGSLPNVSFPLPRSWAGRIHIPNAKDDELFFWLFDAEMPSNDLISKFFPRAKVKFETGRVFNNHELVNGCILVWLNGGPGCSSLDGVTKENGPLYFSGNDLMPTLNPYSWTKLANVLYIDQPVGTGFSDGSVPARNNAEATQYFYQWLTAFYKEFPGLASKNTYLMGESYAGIYVCHSLVINYL